MVVGFTMDIKNVINSKVQKSRQYYKHITFGCVLFIFFEESSFRYIKYNVKWYA